MLNKALRNRFPHKRASAAEALGALRARDAERDLIELLTDKHPYVVRSAIVGLGLMRSRKSIPYLDALEETPLFGSSIRVARNRILADEAARVATQILENGGSLSRTDIRHLGELCCDKAVDWLHKFIDSPSITDDGRYYYSDDRRYNEALLALATIRGTDVLPTIVAYMQRQAFSGQYAGYEGYFRDGAIEALGRLGAAGMDELKRIGPQNDKVVRVLEHIGFAAVPFAMRVVRSRILSKSVPSGFFSFFTKVQDPRTIPLLQKIASGKTKDGNDIRSAQRVLESGFGIVVGDYAQVRHLLESRIPSLPFGQGLNAEEFQRDRIVRSVMPRAMVYRKKGYDFRLTWKRGRRAKDFAAKKGPRVTAILPDTQILERIRARLPETKRHLATNEHVPDARRVLEAHGDLVLMVIEPRKYVRRYDGMGKDLVFSDDRRYDNHPDPARPEALQVVNSTKHREYLTRRYDGHSVFYER